MNKWKGLDLCPKICQISRIPGDLEYIKKVQNEQVTNRRFFSLSYSSSRGIKFHLPHSPHRGGRYNLNAVFKIKFKAVTAKDGLNVKYSLAPRKVRFTAWHSWEGKLLLTWKREKDWYTDSRKRPRHVSCVPYLSPLTGRDRHAV